MLFDSQEEQKWLDALEKGELDDYGRVKQDKDVSMMTARQVGFLWTKTVWFFFLFVKTCDNFYFEEIFIKSYPASLNTE